METQINKKSEIFKQTNGHVTMLLTLQALLKKNETSGTVKKE